MKEAVYKIGHMPALLCGGTADRVYLFVHGRHGCKEEARDFAEIVCPKGWQVLAVDLPEHGSRRGEAGTFDPWHTVPELREVMAHARRRWRHVALRATSIGAWFSMLAFGPAPPERSLLVSPVLDMAGLIRTMMGWAGVTEAELEARGEIAAAFGETLSWRYYQYAKSHPIEAWAGPTAILYAGGDNMTSRGEAEAFAARFHCDLTVMENGEHWFHTEEQLTFLRQWTKQQTEEAL